MLKRIVLTTTVTLTAAFALVSTAAADSERRGKAIEGARCAQAGVHFLTDNNLLAQAARAEIDYDTIDSDIGGQEGPINTDLPPGSFLPLDAVIGLHLTNPELFDWRADLDDEKRRGVARGARCVHAGVRFLVDNNLLISAALQEVDYDTIDSDFGKKEGLINTDLPSPSFLPLAAVIDLHFESPRLFDWCNVAREKGDDRGKSDNAAQRDDDEERGRVGKAEDNDDDDNVHAATDNRSSNSNAAAVADDDDDDDDDDRNRNDKDDDDDDDDGDHDDDD